MLGCTFVKNNNMSKDQTTTLFNPSLSTLLFIVFLILKLTGNIDWSWWWVTSPLWIPLALLLIVGASIAIFYDTKK
jgi:hypothetical protein